MEIPWQSLPPLTLDTLLEEVVTRDGTDYGEVEKTTTQKITAAKNQLKSGFAVLHWDAEIESATLISKEQAQLLDQLKDDEG